MLDNDKIDGMRYPSIDELLKVIDSKYKLAYVAAKRAKIIEEEDYTSLEDPKCKKSIGQALEEILAGDIEITFSDEEND